MYIGNSISPPTSSAGTKVLADLNINITSLLHPIEGAGERGQEAGRLPDNHDMLSMTSEETTMGTRQLLLLF